MDDDYRPVFRLDLSGPVMSGTIQKLCCTLGLAAINCVATARAADFMFRANVDGQILEGQPLHWSATQMLLLGRDGRLYEFNPKVGSRRGEDGGPLRFLLAVRNEDVARA